MGFVRFFVSFFSLPILLASFALVLTGCSQFRHLAKDVETLKQDFVQYEVQIKDRLETDTLILILLEDLDALKIDGFDVMLGEHDITLQAHSSSRYLFVFIDKNNDLRFQVDEEFELIKLTEADSNNRLNVTLNATDTDFPINLVDKPLKEITNMRISKARFAEVTTLTDNRFDRSRARLGMWQPITHLQQENAGLFFLSPFDESKIPVILVHGMAGTARDFEPLIAGIDKEKYQIWVFNYPTGLPLLMVAKGLDNLVRIIKAKHQFDQAHLLAHSMGGLVSKAYLNICTKTGSCNEIISFTSISSPFGGVDSAQSGVDYAPVVMPSWRDLAPKSEFIEDLFTASESMPPHQLNFGYQISGLLNQQSGDGVISLASQLTLQAQQSADMLRGYDEDHVGILTNEQLHRAIAEFWQQAEQSQ
ncbi:alpha/beta fold hydrolase [Shewanella sp. UCD-KL12]|uniref:alpha/beta fold hydrolase n=1 Tax=Shewanella sp. UCD-KL12 TaxID=1917163 RepID=UPI00097104A8|nr:alpha/beta fold hydrolase [Shewanella sp. UCD-KL12]